MYMITFHFKCWEESLEQSVKWSEKEGGKRNADIAEACYDDNQLLSGIESMRLVNQINVWIWKSHEGNELVSREGVTIYPRASHVKLVFGTWQTCTKLEKFLDDSSGAGDELHDWGGRVVREVRVRETSVTWVEPELSTFQVTVPNIQLRSLLLTES